MPTKYMKRCLTSLRNLRNKQSEILYVTFDTMKTMVLTGFVGM